MTQGYKDPAGSTEVRGAAKNPNSVGALLEKAMALHRRGELELAANAYKTIIGAHPGCFDAFHLLGHIAKAQGNVSQALECYRAALALRPAETEFHYSLGVVCQEAEQLDQAADAYRKALRGKPTHSKAQENLAIVLAAQRRFDEAVSLLEQAAEAKPDNPQLLANLAEILRQRGDLPGAAAVARRAVAAGPNHPTSHHNLAVILAKSGDVDGAIAHTRRVMELEPHNRAAHSALLLLLHYQPGLSADELYAEHRRWNTQHTRPATAPPLPVAPDRTRKLRVGYVSPDFRRHAVAHFFEPLLRQHDRSRFALYAYAEVAEPDAVTARLKQHFDGWCDIHRMSAEDVAAKIRDDGIDILVDLAGHTNQNRLDVFALKPAPVQINYLGYPDTTGLDAMDFRITDTLTDPPGRSDHLASEILTRLDPPFLCYSAPSHSPDVGPLPALRNGYITFGSYNNLLKVTDPILRDWAAILRAVPNSRLELKTLADVEGDGERRLREVLASENIAPERIIVRGFVPDSRAFLQLYSGIDIALDTFPYHGTTTTCDALWMGVPVITLAGETHVSRVGVSLLTSSGLPELVAATSQQYRDIAVALANDLPRLRRLRNALRGRVAASPLADATAFTRRFEGALQSMWHSRCIPDHEPTPSILSTQRSQAMSSPANFTSPVVCTSLADGVEVCVPDSLEDFTSYVLREQGDWFEPELNVVRAFLQPGMTVSDWGAGYGVYALAAARCVGSKGVVLAWENDGARAQCLDKASRLNGFANVRRLPLAAPDLAAAQPDLAAALPARLDFIRIDAQIDTLAWLADNDKLLRAQSPLLMVFIGEDTAPAPEVTNHLSALGYAPFAAIPGLNQLVPYEENLADPYRLNLFFCKPDRAAQLLQRGLLGRWLGGNTETLASWRAGIWVEALSHQAYTAGFSALWGKLSPQAVNEPGLKLHIDALDLHTAAHDAQTRNDLRFALLTEALAKISEAVCASATPARLQTLARICTELGLRQHAVDALDALMQHFLADIQVQLDEPFLAVSPAAAAIDSSVSPGRWCLLSVLEARETARHFSSFFYSPEDAAFLDEIEQAGLSTPLLAQRRALLQRRAAHPVAATTPVLSASR